MELVPCPPIYDLDRWQTWEWRKVLPEQNQYRYYRLILRQNLWGEWELIREWGRIGHKPTRSILQILANPESVTPTLQDTDRTRQRRGYQLC